MNIPWGPAKEGDPLQLKHIEKDQWIKIGYSSYYIVGKVRIINLDKVNIAHHPVMPFIELSPAIVKTYKQYHYEENYSHIFVDEYQYYRSSKKEFEELRAQMVIQKL